MGRNSGMEAKKRELVVYRGETAYNEIKTKQKGKYRMAGWSQGMCKIGKRITS